MEIQMLNFGYFFWLFLSIASVVGLYFILKNKSKTTQKVVLFCILVFALVLHFLKAFIPPYNSDPSSWYRHSWFVNICGANIALFPFIFMCKSEKAKDFMFYLGILGGLGAILYPAEPMLKANQSAEMLDIIRFYIHHTILWGVPLLMVKFKLHTLSYKRILWVPVSFMLLLLFIMLNQIFQSELGFVPLRGNDLDAIGYMNNSMIWGPEGAIGDILKLFCPEIFKYVPVGSQAGTVKYWPWFWLLFPAFIILTPVCFLMCLIFDKQNFKADLKAFKEKRASKI